MLSTWENSFDEVIGFLLLFQNGHRWQIFQDLLGTDQDNLDLANVNLMLELLVQKKKQLEAVSNV